MLAGMPFSLPPARPARVSASQPDSPGDIHAVSTAQALFEAAEWIFSAAKPSFSPAPGVKIPIA